MKKLLCLLFVSLLFASTSWAADSKVTALTELAAAPAESDELYLNDAGVDKKITVLNLMNALESALTGFEIHADNVPVNASTETTFTNKTLDANGTGNVLKGYGYITLLAPHLFGAGVTQQTTATAEQYGQALFAHATDKATNYVEYRCEIPRDIDTAVDLVGYFKFRLGGADTGDHEYEISMQSVADSGDYTGTPANAVSLAFTADAAGADGDVETATATLTAWKDNVTAGQLWVIRVARDGDHANDGSTANSYSGPLTIRYGFTQ